MAAQHISVTLRCHLMFLSLCIFCYQQYLCMFMLSKVVHIYDWIIYVYSICLYIYVYSENCCWVGDRSNIRCVYIYITIYIHIYIYSYKYYSHRCLCLFHALFPSFRKSAGNKGREELNAKAGRKQAEIPRNDLVRILFMCCGFFALKTLSIHHEMETRPFENLYRDLDVS